MVVLKLLMLVMCASSRELSNPSTSQSQSNSDAFDLSSFNTWTEFGGRRNSWPSSMHNTIALPIHVVRNEVLYEAAILHESPE